MATTEDIARLILEADTQGFVDAEKKILSTRAALDALTHDYRSGVIGMDEYVKEGKKLQGELDDITVAYKQAGDAAKKFGSNAAAASALAEATGRATNKMASLGQAGLQTGRVIQDFAQGGVAGVINNIEGLVQAVGGGAGLAGALTILGTAFFVLKPVIAEFLNSMNDANAKPVVDFTDAIGTLGARIKELEDKKVKIRVEVEELKNAKQQIDDIKKGLAALEAAKSGRTEGEQASGSEFTKQFEATGREGVRAIEDVERMAGDAYVERDPEVRAARRALGERKRRLADAQKRQKEAEQRRDAAMGSGDVDTINALNSQAFAKAGEVERLKDPETMATLAGNVTQKEQNAREKASAEVGNTLAKVKQGNDAMARDIAALRFREAGHGKFAELIESTSPEALKKKHDADLARSQAVEFDEHLAKQGAEDLKYMKEQAKKANDAENARLNKQGKEGEAEALRENRAMLKEQEDAKTAKDKATDARVKANEKSLDEREKSLKDTTLDEDAAEYAARIRAQGGDFDRRGRFRKLNPDQQRAAVENQVGRRVASANPGLDPLSRGALTDRFTQGAYQQANEQAEQARMAIAQQAEANGVNLSAQQITNAALQQALGALTAVAQKQRQEEAKTQALARALGQVNRQVRMPGQPNLNMGHQ